MKRPPSAVDELVPLADRLRHLQLIRVVLVAVFVAYLAVVPEAAMVSKAEIAWVLSAYLGGSFVGFAVWHLSRARNIRLFGGLIIVDGAYLVWSSWATGGPTGPLQYLVVVHVVVVALLASYRTAMKLALWHSLLAVMALHAARVGILVPGPGGPGVGSDYQRMATFLVLVWLAAVATAAFAAVNERELRRRKVDLEGLASLAHALEQATTPLDVAVTLRASLVDGYGFPRVVVLVVDGDDLVALAGAERSEWAVPLAELRGPVATALTERTAQLVGGLDPGADASFEELLGPARNLLVVPLFAEGHAVGMVVAEHGMRRDSRIARRVVTMVERFCDHGALALRNAVLVDTLRGMATTDGLTGLANRRAFDDVLVREVARSRRSGEPTSLVLVDLDHFKDLNDRYGHQAGDEVLQAVAAVLLRQCRLGDVVARYGGEEIAVVLPGCATATAVETAERLRAAVAGLEFGNGMAVTASFGVATFPDHAIEATSLVAAADRGLYEAKRRGRDRVVVGSVGEKAVAS